MTTPETARKTAPPTIIESRDMADRRQPASRCVTVSEILRELQPVLFDDNRQAIPLSLHFDMTSDKSPSAGPTPPGSAED